jgi:hypothetical protein
MDMAVALPEVDTQVIELKTEALSLVQRAVALTITDDITLGAANDALGVVARLKKNLEERRGFFVKPLNDQVKRVNEWFKGLSTPLDQADLILRDKVLAYRREVERQRAEELARQQAKAEAEAVLAKLAAEDAGLPAPEPVLPAFLPQAPAVKNITSDLAATNVRKVWTFDITDPAQVPREFCTPDERIIRAHVASGIRVIAGVSIYQKESLAVSAR